jgi:hypothetical protein
MVPALSRRIFDAAADSTGRKLGSRNTASVSRSARSTDRRNRATWERGARELAPKRDSVEPWVSVRIEKNCTTSHVTANS